MVGPDAALQPFGIGGHGQKRLPPPVLNAAQQAAGLMAEPPCGRGHSDVTAKAGFDTARTGLLDHDDQAGLTHQVANQSRRIRV